MQLCKIMQFSRRDACPNHPADEGTKRLDIGQATSVFSPRSGLTFSLFSRRSNGESLAVLAIRAIVATHWRLVDCAGENAQRRCSRDVNLGHGMVNFVRSPLPFGIEVGISRPSLN